jgi:endonuclease VIII
VGAADAMLTRKAAESTAAATTDRLAMPGGSLARSGCAGRAISRKYAGRVPEGDALARAARRLQVLVGERVEVEAPHPRAAVKGVAERLDGRLLVAVEAVGKNLLFRFDDGVVLRSHLRMSGRWSVRPRDARPHSSGRPWLVLRGSECEAVLWNGPVLELDDRGLRRLGPDILARPADLETMLANLRRNTARTIGEALLDQRNVAGIGNAWKVEALWEARVSPWRRVGDVSDEELRSTLDAAHRLMSASAAGARRRRAVYRRAGRLCTRCGTAIRSRGQGEDNRIVYWCQTCQR